MIVELTFNLDMRLTESNIPQFIPQYSDFDIEVKLPQGIDDTLYLVSYNMVRPDGVKANEVYFEYDSERELWIGKATSYHTYALLGETGNIRLSITLRKLNEWMRTSPLIRVPIIKSNEPKPEEIEPRVIDLLFHKISNIEQSAQNHSLLSLSSRAAKNSHPIGAISGLEEEISVFVGSDSPVDNSRTWFHIDEGEDAKIYQTLHAFPLIELGQQFTMGLSTIGPVQIVVKGNVLGETMIQYLRNDTDPYFISGDVILYVDENPANTKVVYLEFEFSPMLDYLTVIKFQSKGESITSNFVAERIEVYR